MNIIFNIPPHRASCSRRLRPRSCRLRILFAAFVFTTLVLSFPIGKAEAQTDRPAVDRDRLSAVVDDSPLVRGSDKAAWDYLFGILRRSSQETIDALDAPRAGFLELERQPVEYRGRWVSLSGRLLRCEFWPLRPDATPFDDPAKGEKESPDAPSVETARHGFYKSWILLPDRKDVPVCVCSLDVPPGIDVEGNDQDTPVFVTGIFYKRQLFLSDGEEEVTTPTLLAKTFRVIDSGKNEPVAGQETKPSSDRLLLIAIVFLAAFWAAFRLIGSRMFPKRSRGRIRFGSSGDLPEGSFDGKIAIGKVAIDKAAEKENASENEHPTVSVHAEQTTVMPPKIIPVLLTAVLSLSFSDRALPAESIDAEFTREQLLQMDEFSWEALGNEIVPLEQQREPIVAMLDRLRRFVPPSFLREHVSASFSATTSVRTTSAVPLSALTRDPAQYRGKAFRLQGFVTTVDDIPLNPVERTLLELPAVYRCRFLIPNQGEAEILTTFVPSDWKRGEAIQERAAVTGIYVKQLPSGKSAPFLDERDANDATKHDGSGNGKPAGETATESKLEPKNGGWKTDNTDGLQEEIWREFSDTIPLLIAPRVEWFPRTFLGDIGMDVGSMDQIPVLRIADLKANLKTEEKTEGKKNGKTKKFETIPPALQLLGRSELIRRAFKFTQADREPFYGLLHAASLTPPGRIEQEAREQLKPTGRSRSAAVPLFNDPAGSRGKPVLLTGIAKRVLPTLVEDAEVKKIYGIDKYYQIYFFTEDSQNNPLVACVTSLPNDMPIGSGDDYAEQITIGAFPYKLWVYETSAKLEDEEGNPLGNKPSYAPLLIGRSPTWHPKPKTIEPPFGADWPSEVKTTVTFGLFVALFLAWLLLRRFKSGKPIEFKLRK